MGKAAAARKLASAAAYGGGGLSVLGAGLYGVLAAEAKLARKAIGRTNLEPPDSTGWYGRGRPGPAIKIALLGDSSAAGYGVDRVEDTPGAHLASGVAAAADRRVYLRHVAVVGAKSTQLEEQVDRVLPMAADVAVILVGVNDVTHKLLPSQSVRYLGEAVRRLVEGGTAVLVGTCPDLGTIRPIAQPLRRVAREWSRRLAAAQAITVVDAGGRTVSLGSILGPEFDAAPALFFGPDRFHPSADGYRSLAGVLIPSTMAALGLVPDEQTPDAHRGERVMPVAAAAVRAARTPGTELDGTEVGGAQRGLRGRWVQMRHRRRQPALETTCPDSAEVSETPAG
ncbi:SGNH/GDSL hydrolase family protein [Nocardioides sp. LHG3406-4]|uniref:SGNH/GDSL hydrolase family protein n=1 Tax=Nocardioides sp. LHG3406-4 TaxID=2804575 RepID=UPI003CF4DD3A